MSDVDTEGFEEMLGHGLETLGTVNLQRHATADRPRREDQVGITDCMVGVKMGNERDAHAIDHTAEEAHSAVDHFPPNRRRSLSHLLL